MGVKLAKKAVVSLTKQAPTTKSYVVGLGWDPVDNSQEMVQVTRRKPGLAGLFGATETVMTRASELHAVDIDCDAAVMLENSHDRSKDELVYFGHKISFDGSIIHLGDNLTGRKDESIVKGCTNDKEQIEINTEKLSSEFDTIWIGVNIYKAILRNQHFGKVNNSFIRIMDKNSGEEICRFDLDGYYKNMTGVIMGKLYRDGNDWKFVALGDGFRADGIHHLFSYRTKLK